MDHAQPLSREFPWRTAAVVVGVVAAVELVALIGIGAARLVAPVRAHPVAAAHAAVAPRTPAHHVKAPPPHPLRPRRLLSVLVLNGNGVSGAAGSKAVGLQTIGYGAARSENAPRHDYARSMVMYVPGYEQEARRLGHDAGIRAVGLVDGMRKAQLSGSQLVVVLGGS